MADNALTVLDAAGATKSLRSEDVGSNVQAQGVMVWEGPETPAVLTGATVRYTVDNSPVVSLAPPSGGARYARVRVFETSQNQAVRLYYRSDGTNPIADGSNAFGFLLHGELIMVKLDTFSNFKMVAEGSSIFEVYVEWLANP